MREEVVSDQLQGRLRQARLVMITKEHSSWQRWAGLEEDWEERNLYVFLRSLLHLLVRYENVFRASRSQSQEEKCGMETRSSRFVGT